MDDVDVVSPRSPNGGIGGAKERDGWNPYGGGQMRDAAIVADVESGTL